MPFSTAAKNEMLDGTVVDLVSIHTGDPGAAGTDNEVTGDGYARLAGTFNAAASGERVLNADLDFDGPALEDALYFGLWEDGTPDVFKGGFPIASGDVAFNASGEFTLKATTTKMALSDPA